MAIKSKPTMEEIIEKVGNFGVFQALLFSATTFTIVFSVSGMMFMMYGNYNPGWTCSNGTLTNTSNGNEINVSTTPILDVTSGSTDECSLWRECTDVVYEKESSTVVTEWNLMCDNAWIPSLVITIQMCGVFLGSCICGPLGDRFGRRVSLYSSVALYGVANLICAFSPSWQCFAVLRFFIGAAVGGILSTAPIYCMEFVGSWWRPVLLSVPNWPIGSINFVLVVYIFKDWKQVHLAISALSVLAFLPVFWMPESMRWMAVQGKVEDIKHVVQRMASWNRMPPVDQELIETTIKTIIKSQNEEAKPSYLDLFKTTKLRKYSIKFGTMWIIMALVYYLITFGVKAFSGNFYFNMILFALSEIPGPLLVGPLANKVGRKFTAIFLFILSAVFSLGVVVVDFIPGSTAGSFLVVSAVISKAALTGVWCGVLMISTELYPTIVRNLHAGYLNGVSRLGSIVSSYMIPADSSKLFIPFAISGALLLFSAVIIVSVSESKGKPMADTMQQLKTHNLKEHGNNGSEEIVKLNEIHSHKEEV